MTETIRESHTEADSAAAVLAAVRSSRSVADAEEARLLQLAVSWVGMHSVDSIDQAATVWDRTYGDTGITVAGPGAPLVAEFRWRGVRRRRRSGDRGRQGLPR